MTTPPLPQTDRKCCSSNTNWRSRWPLVFLPDARQQIAFIGLVSGFGVVDSLLEKATQSLLILPICLCAVWWVTIYSYRRINKAKWNVIYKLEKNLPATPFTDEGEGLGSKSFMLTKRWN